MTVGIDSLSAEAARYVAETRRLNTLSTTTEETFYPAIRALLGAVLQAQHLPFEVRTGTSEAKAQGTDRPDFVLADTALFVGVFGEVKRPDMALEEIASSTEREDQIGRYLARTGVVLITNVRGFGLLTCAPGYSRAPESPVPPEQRELIGSVELWGSATGKGTKLRIDPQAVTELTALVERSVTDFAPIADPADLAKILARQARDAKAGLPDDLSPVAPLLDDYRQALGLSFDINDEKGDRFFRSSLIQTAFYSLFAAWILWDRSEEAEPFDLEKAQAHLRIPFLEQLFYDIRHPHYLRELGLARHLERAVATLNRVDRKLFRSRMTFPTVDDENPTVAAITYFYEPFLESFDPKLRDELGVWYTPPEIVRYQVGRIHHILKTDLDIPRGLADPNVFVLDPCCGTGAYLLEVARCIADELRREGDLDVLGLELLKAFEERVIGFEILTAPFAIAQLQLYILLAELGVEPPKGHRLAIFLTNALTGWHDQGDIKLNFPEMRDEFDASQSVKHSARIIVILGNPPYDRFAGAAQAEEVELVAHYKGVELVVERGKDGQVKRDEFGRPKKKQRGQTLLYKEFGVRKQLLDDLYVRFLRLAEERIGEAADYGIVSYISNSSYLTGRSHPMMRRSLLSNFHRVWIDNLNGDKFKTGKMIPKGLPGEGTADQSAFTTDMDARGIQPGTAIVTWLKRPSPKTAPGQTHVEHRDFWGLANWKRTALLASLPSGAPGEDTAIPPYEVITPTPENRWRLSPHTQEAGYENWPGLDELFPVRFQGVNPNRGLDGSVIDTDRETLRQRMTDYFGAETFEIAVSVCPNVAKERARYEPEDVWTKVKASGGFVVGKLQPFLTFPLDQRWLYYETAHKWLNEARSEFGANLEQNEFLVTVPEPRKASETRPVFATTLVNLHVHERGSVVIPRETRGDDLLADRDANLPEATWRIFRNQFGLSGHRRDKDARRFAGSLLRVVLAILHAPAYQTDHRSALSADWAHVPIPRDRTILDQAAVLGEQLASLMDAHRDAAETVIALLGQGRAATLAQIHRTDGKPIRPKDLKVTVNYWGGARGRWVARPFLSDEEPLPAWGEQTGDLYIGDEVFFANVPEAVWKYELGGYPVLKKWLGYRQANRRDDQPLTTEERRWFKSVVQRIAALLALAPSLDELYSAASEDAFTAEELGIER
ncbi:MAG: N-6 DNA methylase [Proteobacteria bacterium]|nr:N-6 DNA methylase [Pseudomonadota bacterium]